MMNFFKPSSSPTGVAFGVNLPVNNKSLSAEINDVSESFIKTNKNYRDEINKYKQIANFNKNLSKSYIANVTAMIDVSKLLNDYSIFFDILKNEISNTSNSVGSIDAQEIDYLKNLTKDKLDELINVFKTQTDKVKTIYKKFGQMDELNTIESAQNLMSAVSDNAKTTYSSLTGGARYIKKKRIVSNKKKNVKKAKEKGSNKC
jgi:hypothetical protein